jgi:hypothetical protein
LKVAFDEHIPLAMVRVFQLFASERSFQSLASGLIIESARDYAPRPGDADYMKGNDVPWIRRFAAAGGKVIISGDTKMMREDHERLALVETGMVVIFFGSQWSGWKFHRKCALLLNWWQAIAKMATKAKPGFWRVPTSWRADGKLIPVPNVNNNLVRIEKQMAAQTRVAAERRAKRAKAAAEGQGDFFEAGAGNDAGQASEEKKK